MLIISDTSVIAGIALLHISLYISCTAFGSSSFVVSYPPAQEALRSHPFYYMVCQCSPPPPTPSFFKGLVVCGRKFSLDNHEGSTSPTFPYSANLRGKEDYCSASSDGLSSGAGQHRGGCFDAPSPGFLLSLSTLS
jgi:hypothetical protein